MVQVSDKTFSTEEAARLSGLTLRQLQWEAEHGCVNPKRNNKNFRCYTPQEVLLLLVRSLLESKGANRETIKRALEYIENDQWSLLDQIREARQKRRGTRSNFFLAVNERSVLAASNMKVMMNFITTSGSSVYAINITGPKELMDSL